MAQHTPHPNRPVGSAGSTSCATELFEVFEARDECGMDSPEGSREAGDPPEAEEELAVLAVRRRGGFKVLESETETETPLFHPGAQVNKDREAALWRTLEDAGISLPPSHMEKED